MCIIADSTTFSCFSLFFSFFFFFCRGQGVEGEGLREQIPPGSLHSTTSPHFKLYKRCDPTERSINIGSDTQTSPVPPPDCKVRLVTRIKFHFKTRTPRNCKVLTNYHGPLTEDWAQAVSISSASQWDTEGPSGTPLSQEFASSCRLL